MLYIVPTPIGNIEDISLRALRLLKEVNYIITEKTNTSKKLLQAYDIDHREKHFVKFTSHDTYRINNILSSLKTQDGLLMSEAGTPALSDPGKQLIQAALEEPGLEVTILPGANALIPAVIMSNFPTTKRTFYGFIPHKKGRETLLKTMIASDKPSFFYESVHRMPKLIQQLDQLNYRGKLSIAREMSKLHEQFITEDFDVIQQKIDNGEIPQRGEFVVGLYPSL